MTGYLPYLIEKHGYSEESVIRWIEKQLKTEYCTGHLKKSDFKDS